MMTRDEREILSQNFLYDRYSLFSTKDLSKDLKSIGNVDDERKRRERFFHKTSYYDRYSLFYTKDHSNLLITMMTRDERTNISVFCRKSLYKL